MAFPDSTCTCGYDDWFVRSDSSEVVEIHWVIASFLRECQGERKELRSYGFGFAGATWNLFASFDPEKNLSLFKINVKPIRLSDAVFDCYCDILFEAAKDKEIKAIFSKFKRENTDSHMLVEDFLTESELNEFLKEGCNIYCRITLRKADILEACPWTEIFHSSSSSTVETCTETQLLPDHSMAFPDPTTPCYCNMFRVCSSSSEEVTVTWEIPSFPNLCHLEIEKILKSCDFGFAGATWNLFTSLDKEKNHSLFGINVKPLRLSDAVFACSCDIQFISHRSREIAKKEHMFRCENADSHWLVENFLSNSELDEVLEEMDIIKCNITVHKSSIKDACPRAEITHSRRSSAVEAHTQTDPLPKGDEELPTTSFESKVCKDFKNLLLSGEDSDVTLKVQDQQFKAHQVILTARSSVFASMFRHDTKEKATGIVDVADCEPSVFLVLLQFMYCGSTEKLCVDNMFSLYASADKYDLQDLKMKCLQFIQSNLSVDTFCKTLHLSLQHSETDLLKLATDFFIRNCQQITLSPEWQTFLSENPIQGNELFIKATKYISLNPC